MEECRSSSGEYGGAAGFAKETLRRLFPDPHSRAAGAVFAAAAVVRIAAVLRVAVIAPDGVRFMEQAKSFYRLDFATALSQDYHPLYPMLTAIARLFTGGFESAALTVSIVFSLFTAPLVYYAAAGLFGKRPALVSAAVFAFVPPFVRTGADTLSEGVFLFFLALSVLAASAAFRKGGFPRPVAAGAAGCAAYLTRPEGLLILAATGACTAASIAAGREGRTRAGICATGILFLASFIAPAFPYLLHIRAETGRWDFSMKKSVVNFQATLEEKLDGGSIKATPGEKVMGPVDAAWEIAERLANNFFFVPAAFALIGLFAPALERKKRPWRDELLPGFTAGAWIGACFFLLLTHGYLSSRHTLPATLVLLPYAGMGAVLVSTRLGGILDRARLYRRMLPQVPGGVFVLGFLIVLAFTAGIPENVRTYRKDKEYEKTIGLEIGTWPDRGVTSVGNCPRIGYYAGMTNVIIPFDARPGEVETIARSAGATLLVVEEGHLGIWAPSLLTALRAPAGPPFFSPVKSWTTGGRRPKKVSAFRIAE